MKVFEYMRFPFKFIPKEIVDHYNLQDKVSPNSWVYIKIRKGMYGLKQGGILANEKLTDHLVLSGYYPTPLTHSLWNHKARKIKFSLVVNDSGIKYEDNANTEHLLQNLCNKHPIYVYWTGQLYSGLSISWNYAKHYVDISMPGYVNPVLHKFCHPQPTRPEDAPQDWTQPTYGTRIQYAEVPSRGITDKN